MVPYFEAFGEWKRVLSYHAAILGDENTNPSDWSRQELDPIRRRAINQGGLGACPGNWKTGMRFRGLVTPIALRQRFLPVLGIA
jgi:hypothetical protein